MSKQNDRVYVQRIEHHAVISRALDETMCELHKSFGLVRPPAAIDEYNISSDHKWYL